MAAVIIFTYVSMKDKTVKANGVPHFWHNTVIITKYMSLSGTPCVQTRCYALKIVFVKRFGKHKSAPGGILASFSYLGENSLAG